MRRLSSVVTSEPSYVGTWPICQILTWLAGIFVKIKEERRLACPSARELGRTVCEGRISWMGEARSIDRFPLAG
jgi:hypothetical protein